MFGYVRAYSPELRMREYEYYRGVYCGLCRAMGRCTGCVSRLTLSYDAAFLALVRMALTGDAPRAERSRCAVHPLKARPVCTGCDSLDYAAKAGAVLAYYNLRDDIADKRGLHRIARMTASPMLRHACRRADLPELARDTEKMLLDLSSLEKSGSAPPDALADCFGELLANIFAYGLDGAEARIARNIGCHVGRWIYLIDAADDYQKDVRRGEFNPFAGSGLPSKETVRTALACETAALETAADLLRDRTQPEIYELICNILFLGTENEVKRILGKM